MMEGPDHFICFKFLTYLNFIVFLKIVPLVILNFVQCNFLKNFY